MYSEEELKKMYKEFQALKFYKEKISFYDVHFGIIPFDFPGFSTDLPIFFLEDRTQILTDIFNKERKNPVLSGRKNTRLMEKIFVFGNRTYKFNIRPMNSNNQVYNNFVTVKFLDAFMNCPEKNLLFYQNANSSADLLLEQANNRLNYIESKINSGNNDKSYLQHFMKVFHKGMMDAVTDKIKPSPRKKKFIELYLYAQGIAYADYIKTIKNPEQILL